MKFLTICALVLAPIYAIELPSSKTKSGSIEQAKVQLQGRIINGIYAADRQFPYQAALYMIYSDTKYELCGGSLIDKQWVLTAAHCTVDAKSAAVYLGTTQRGSGEVRQTVDKKDFIIHPNYNRYCKSNDISLIKIQPVTYSAQVQPVQLPATSKSYSNYAGNMAIATGWGHFDDKFDVTSSYLRFASFLVINNDDCKKAYSSYIGTENICATSCVGASICTGDFGGPLVLENSKVLVGIASYVEDCKNTKPAVFARVTSYLDWIKSKTGALNAATIIQVNSTVVTNTANNIKVNSTGGKNTASNIKINNAIVKG